MTLQIATVIELRLWFGIRAFDGRIGIWRIMSIALRQGFGEQD